MLLCEVDYVDEENKMNSIVKVIDTSKQNVKLMKKHTPYLFNEWLRLERAKENLEYAKAELAAAQKAWDQL